MDKELLLKKWLADQLTNEELEVFKSTGDYKKNLEVIRYAHKFKAPDFSPTDHIVDLLPDLAKNSTKTKRLWPARLLRVAATLLIGFVIYYFYPASSLVNVSTAVSEKVTIELPDASRVTVNAGSEVSYVKNTWKFRKHLDLQGEAYFDVVKEGKFKVNTPEGTVTVLGTKFNVKQRAQYFEVECYEGVVRVTSEQYERTLKAGEVLRVVNGALLTGTHVYQEPQWTSNVSAFENTPLSQVLAELERQYGITIITLGIDSSRMFSGGFVHQDLESALTAITEPLNLSYSLDSNGLVTISPK
jgi:ferric-dicitrate binding protein FerR (iron transport regulator)